jgi:TPR repeat protein
MYWLKKDSAKAKFWWEKAAEQGDTKAKEMLEKLKLQ